MGADEKGVFQHGPVGVLHAGKQGKHVLQHDHKHDGRGDHHRQRQGPDDAHGPRGAETQMIEDVAVQPQEEPAAQQDQPDLGGLAEILPEGAEELGGHMAVLLPHDLQAGVVQRGGGGTHGHDGQGAEKPEHIQHAGVAELQQQLAELAFIGKKLHDRPLFRKR